MPLDWLTENYGRGTRSMAPAARQRGKSRGKSVCAQKTGFYEVCEPNILAGHPRGMIFQNELARKSDVPIVRSCEDRKPWFSRLKTSCIGACHPGASIFQMKDGCHLSFRAVGHVSWSGDGDTTCSGTGKASGTRRYRCSTVGRSATLL